MAIVKDVDDFIRLWNYKKTMRDGRWTVVNKTDIINRFINS